jgi:hypothetical protein
MSSAVFRPPGLNQWNASYELILKGEKNEDDMKEMKRGFVDEERK